MAAGADKFGSFVLEQHGLAAPVRVLVDDYWASGHDPAFQALDAHPNIEVRMFNPFESRSGSVSCPGTDRGTDGRRGRPM